MQEHQKKIPVAVVTGGHPYDVPNFHRLFRNLPSLDCYLQHMEDFIESSETVRDSYDAVVLFNFNRTPMPDGKEKAAIEHLGNTKQGIVVLHHALWSYPQWPLWTDLCGIANGGLGAKAGQPMHLEITRVRHPITAGLRAWDMIDETYRMADAAEGSEVLVTTDNPDCMKTIAWTRQYKKAHVFCLELGHDNLAWTNQNFHSLLERGLAWCACPDQHAV